MDDHLGSRWCRNRRARMNAGASGGDPVSKAVSSVTLQELALSKESKIKRSGKEIKMASLEAFEVQRR